MNQEDKSRLVYTLVKWADITIKEFQKEMIKRNMSRNRLYRSFTYNIKYNSNGIPSEVSIGFLFHGRFVDMGVGKGVKLEDVKSNAEVWRSLTKHERKTTGKPRTRKPWYSKRAYREFMVLNVLLQREFGLSVSNTIEEQINDLTVQISI